MIQLTANEFEHGRIHTDFAFDRNMTPEQAYREFAALIQSFARINATAMIKCGIDADEILVLDKIKEDITKMQGIIKMRSEKQAI